MAIKKDFWKQVDERVGTHSRAVLQARQAAAKRDRRRACIERLLHRAGYGTTWSPILPKTIGARYRGGLNANNDHWSLWIRRLALMWKQVIGIEALRRSSMPSAGLGFEVASKIFFEAAEGASSRQLAAHLRRARKSLDAWDQHPGSLCNSDLGLALFFRTLPELFTNKRWSAVAVPGTKRARVPLDESPGAAAEDPRSFGEAENWWSSPRAFMTLIGMPHQAKPLQLLRRSLPPAHGRRRGSEGWWRVADLISAAEQLRQVPGAASTPLARINLPAGWRRQLKPPSFNPKA